MGFESSDYFVDFPINFIFAPFFIFKLIISTPVDTWLAKDSVQVILSYGLEEDDSHLCVCCELVPLAQYFPLVFVEDLLVVGENVIRVLFWWLGGLKRG